MIHFFFFYFDVNPVVLYPIDDSFDRQWGWAVVFKQDISLITTRSTLYRPFFFL